MNKIPYGLTQSEIDRYGDSVIELAEYYNPDKYKVVNNGGVIAIKRVDPIEDTRKKLQETMAYAQYLINKDKEG